MVKARPLNEQLAGLRELDSEAARERSAIADAWLGELWAGTDVPDRVALLALGGYGRGELAPASDIDLLILHDAVERVGEVAEQLFYPLWDSGLTVGHAVRTPQECLSESSARLDVAAAMLDARFLAGDRPLADEMLERLLAWARENASEFAMKLREDARLRHVTYASVTYHLEPDLKEGAGGLRDLNSLGWLAKVAAGGEDRTALVEAGLLRARESKTLNGAEEFLLRERSALHLLTGRRTDRVYLEHQPALAQTLGFEADAVSPAPDALMRATFERGRGIAHVVSLVFARYLEPGADGIPEFKESPEGIVGLFADAAEGAVVLSPALLDRVEQIEVPAGERWSPEVRDSFLRILRAGDRAVPTLEAMDRSGLLGRLIPEWDSVRCRPQRDPFHRFTVDMHLLETLAGMERLLAGHTEDPVAAEAAGMVRDRDAVLLGAMFHDIGKTGGLGGHVPRGVEIAGEALGRMGLPDLTRQAALFLVEQHLLVSDTATRRDLADENLILDVADTVGGQQSLACLYLLSLADAAATGPHAATPWRTTLMRELVAKVQRVLEVGAGAESAEALAERTEAIRAALSGEEPEDVERFIAMMPRAYLTGVSPERAARHFRLLSPAPGPLEVRTDAREGHRPGSHELTIVAEDRPGLLSRVAGALTLAQLSILSAQVFTTDDGIALDLFEVESAFDEEVGEEHWRSFRTNLRKALDGRLSLDFRVKEKRGYYPPPRRDIPIEVEVDNDASDLFTVIEVGCADRIGLLFDITRTFGELELDVHLAKVATYGGRVIDAFYVRDVLGRKILDPEHAEEIESAITARLSE